MGLFKKSTIPDNERIDEIEKWIIIYEKKYTDSPMYNYQDELTTEIFDASVEMLRRFTPKSLLKEMDKKKINEENSALNIIHNVTMILIGNTNNEDELELRLGKESLNIYEYINEMKLLKGYISKAQYNGNLKLFGEMESKLN